MVGTPVDHRWAGGARLPQPVRQYSCPGSFPCRNDVRWMGVWLRLASSLLTIYHTNGLEG